MKGGRKEREREGQRREIDRKRERLNERRQVGGGRDRKREVEDGNTEIKR